jgi:hypothetical protein
MFTELDEARVSGVADVFVSSILAVYPAQPFSCMRWGRARRARD